jgi:hypothetical protein
LGHFWVDPIRRVMDSPGLSAEPAFASRSFPLPLGIWALTSRSAYCLGHTPADPIGVCTFRMRKRSVCAVGVGASFTPRSSVFIKAGVVHELRSECDHSSSSQPGNFDDLLLFRRVDEDSLVRSPVRPSPDPVCSPGSGSSWTSPAASHRSLPILHAPDGDGIEHYPGSVFFEPLPSCDLVSHWTPQV